MTASPLSRYPGLFFEPVQLHLQLSDLLVQGILQGLIGFACSGSLIRENLRQFGQSLTFPGRNHVRMHFVMRSYFLNGFLSLYGFYCYSRFEFCCKLSSLSRRHCRPLSGGNDFTPYLPVRILGSSSLRTTLACPIRSVTHGLRIPSRSFRFDCNRIQPTAYFLRLVKVRAKRLKKC